ncbi:COR domain-containing protein [Aquabacterium humicola]|uniref:COR domain-containing protein n=1 Tax=Aquabacterium humicola TaxID=3237377 RepID=UPI002543551B|nr:COR domain-containing protein [Rubrivivax pictus]
MTTPQVINVSAEELDAILRSKAEEVSEITLIGASCSGRALLDLSYDLPGHPIYRLTRWSSFLLETLAGLNHLNQLVLGSLDLSTDDVRAIGRDFGRLSRLGVWGAGLGREDVRVIAEGLPQLTSLDLSGSEIGDEALLFIADGLERLESLDVSGSNIGEASACTIVHRFPRLKSLRIGSNKIGERGAVAIAEGLGALERLDVGRNKIGQIGVRTIAQRLPQLTFLDISGNDLGEWGAKEIASSLVNLQRLDISDNRIGAAGASAIAQQLDQLTSLEISRNEIGVAGTSEITRRLRRLKSLSISKNGLGEDGAKAISQSLLQLTDLNIRSNDIGDVGATLIGGHLANLVFLDIGWNKIGETGGAALASGLQRLRHLDIAWNEIGSVGCASIAQKLPLLTDLDVGHNSIGDAGAIAVGSCLRDLTHLEIESNDITHAGAEAIARLNGLVELAIGFNEIGDPGVRSIATQLNTLTSLKIHSNKISRDGCDAIGASLSTLESLGISYNSIGSDGARHIGRLSRLRDLSAVRCDIDAAGARALSGSLRKLRFLSLDQNKIGDEGVRLLVERLPNLQYLSIEDGGVGDSGVAAIALSSSISYLDLSKNERVSDLSPLASNLSLKRLRVEATSVSDLSPLAARIESGWSVCWDWSYEGIGVRDCPLEIPPVEIARQGPAAVLNYFTERRRQTVARLHEAKVLVVGDGGVGKTSLVRRLYQVDLPLPGEDETTRGIVVHKQDFAADHGGQFRLNVWDFGGQQIYHSTHQFFLTKSSLYVLVDDTRKSDKSIHDESFKFWLEVVETLSDKSPLLIFQNEKGGRSKAIDIAGIRGRFPNVADIYSGNLEHTDSVSHLRKAIQYYVQRLPHVGSEVPAMWIAVRQAIEAEASKRPFMTLEEYFALYASYLEFDRSRALYLSRYLHDLGVFLHFQDDLLLRKTVILQNQWATDAVFRILDDEAIKKAFGRFALQDCERVWSDARYDDMHAELIGLMGKFELCYPLRDSDPECWLAPQLLTPSLPSELADWADPTDLVVRFRYTFLPRGLVNRLMVRQHRFARRLEWSWAHGAFFEHGSTQALVQETRRGSEIELRARGPESKELLSVLVGDLETINETFHGLRDRVEKLVPCICSVCRVTTDPQMYSFPELVERKRRSKGTIECRREPYEDVSVRELLDGIEVGLLPDWASAPEELRPTPGPATREITIFLASSSDLNDDRDEFERYFRQQNDRLRRQGVYLRIVRWESYLDAMSETRLQDDYNKEVRACDVFVSLFETKAGAFSAEEFSVAFDQFRRTGKPRIYTYFKEANVSLSRAKRQDLESLWAFKDKLTELGHFFTSYESSEHLKRHFRDQIDLLLDLSRE